MPSVLNIAPHAESQIHAEGIAYVPDFIGAVCDGDQRKTLAILKAFGFSKTPRNRYAIINAFETAAAIGCLNNDAIGEALEHSADCDFRMEPVENWSTDLAMPAVCQPRIRYDKSVKQLICDGVMRDEQKQVLLAVVTDKAHRMAAEDCANKA
jgi:hypothetical protein